MSLILASRSPRRQQLLQQIGINFEVMVSGIEEIRQDGESPADYVKRNAAEKAAAVLAQAQQTPHLWILAADTIVVHQEQVLEKPADAKTATKMLTQLQGSRHEVLTGFVLRSLQDPAVLHEQVVRTEVVFRALQPKEIQSYIATGEPFDKAGGYGAQGIAAGFVKELHGSYSSVVGLPLAELCEALAKLEAQTARNRRMTGSSYLS